MELGFGRFGTLRNTERERMCCHIGFFGVVFIIELFIMNWDHFCERKIRLCLFVHSL